MYGEGYGFLKIDGRCHFYVFRSGQSPFLSWAPVREGDLDDEALDDVLARLHVRFWPDLTEEALTLPSMHAGWRRFEVAGAVYECTGHCDQEDWLMERVLDGAYEVIAELDALGEPVVGERVEVGVMPVNDPNVCYSVPWGADFPIAEIAQDYVEATLAADVDGFGVFLEPPESQWFLQAADAFREAMSDPRVGRHAIGISDDDGAISHALYVRTVVP